MGYYLKNRQLQTGGPGVVTGHVPNGNVAITNSGNITAIGNITASYFIGNGSQLTGLIADVSNIHNGNSNITIAASNGNAVVGINGTGNVAVFANTGLYVNGLLTGSNISTSGNISIQANRGIVTANSNVVFDSVGQIILNPGYVTSSGDLDFYTANLVNYSELWLHDQGNAVIGTSGATYNWQFGTDGNLSAPGAVSAVGNITANAASFFIGNGSMLTGVVSSTSGFPVVAGTSNISATPSGNIRISVATVNNVLVVANTGTYTTGTASTIGNVVAGNVNTAGNVTVGNLVLSDNTISTTNSTVASFLGSLGLGIPHGNTAQRPSTPPTGTSRLNTDLDQMEMWDGTQWLVIGPTVINNTVTDQQFAGDGVTTSFVLSEPASPASLLVSLNGVGQLPGVAYTVTGTSLDFTQAPANGDIIDVRFLAAALSHDLIYDSYGNAVVRAYDTPEIVMSINSANALAVGTNLVIDISGSTSLQLPVYTVAQTANIAVPTAGQTIYVTDGDGGNPCLAVYSAGAWKRIAFGANISAT